MDLEPVLVTVRPPQADDQAGLHQAAQRRGVHRHASQRGIEGVGLRGGDAAESDPVGGPDQHHAVDRRPVRRNVPVDGSGHGTRVDVAGMRGDDRLGPALRGLRPRR